MLMLSVQSIADADNVMSFSSWLGYTVYPI